MIVVNNKILAIFSGLMVVLFIGCNKDIKNQKTNTTDKMPSLTDLATVIIANDTLSIDINNNYAYSKGGGVSLRNSDNSNFIAETEEYKIIKTLYYYNFSTRLLYESCKRAL